jgi:RNA polymerase sigma-70 factor (ECF subfamily)
MFDSRESGSAADGETGRIAATGLIELEVVALYDEHAAALHRFAAASGAPSPLAQDAVQEAFLRYFLTRNSGSRPAQPKMWLFQFVHEYVKNRLAEQDAESHFRFPVEGLAGGGPESAPELRWADREENLTALLTPREKECLRLRAEGLPYRDIAKVLNISMGNVSAKLSRAVRKLQIHLWREKR